MIEVERRRMIAAPAGKIKTVLIDVAHLDRLLPRAERVEVHSSNDNRARLSIMVRGGKLGLQRLDGEARILDNGLRFVAVQPVEVDARWTVQERGGTSEVTARLSIQPGGMFGSLGRFMPQRLVEQRIGQELEASLDALEELLRE